MLAKGRRLRRSIDFRQVYRRGRSVANGYLVLYYAPNKTENTRFGYSVSKKMGKAIIRNRLKRLLREVCRLHQEQFRQGFDLIFIPRQKIKGISYRLVENHLLEICHKAKLLDKPFEVKGEEK